MNNHRLIILLSLVLLVVGTVIEMVALAWLSYFTFLWGMAVYARRKGYGALFGILLGLINIFGLIILYFLPQRLKR